MSICRVSWRRSNRGREQRLRESNRNSEIRASETFQDRIRDADDFTLTIEEWPAGTSRSGLGVEDDFVGQDISDVALRNDRMNEFAVCQLRQNLRYVAVTVSQYLPSRTFVGARKDSGKPRRIAHQYNGLPCHCSSLP